MLGGWLLDEGARTRNRSPRPEGGRPGAGTMRFRTVASYSTAFAPRVACCHLSTLPGFRGLGCAATGPSARLLRGFGMNGMRVWWLSRRHPVGAWVGPGGRAGARRSVPWRAAAGPGPRGLRGTAAARPRGSLKGFPQRMDRIGARHVTAPVAAQGGAAYASPLSASCQEKPSQTR